MEKIEIDISKTYSLSKEIRIVEYKEKYLAIYTAGILWIVLDNNEELKIFEDLRKGKTLKTVFDKFSEEAVLNVIMQIEAKKFDHPSRIENDEKNAYIYLTNNCNQRCRHCYMYSGEFAADEVPYEKWIEIIDKLKLAGFQGVTFTGGEVTVYNGYEKLIKYAHEIGLLVTVLSNGILWTHENVERMHNYIDEIQISIDGYDKNSYYEVRKYDGFEKAISTVVEFYQAGTKVSVAVTPLYDKMDDFIENYEQFARIFMKKYPEVFIKFNYELIPGREVKPSDEENKEYRRKMKSLMERLYPEYYTETFVLNYENKAIRKNCGFGGISISSNGDAYWCNRIHELVSTANVFEMDFNKIVEISNQIKDYTSVDNTKGCKDCEIKYICGGGCRMKYKGIRDALTHQGEWTYMCDGKEQIYEKMILSNEYFFEEE